MNVIDYYRHARSLGPFRAIDCLTMAREAFILDCKSKYLPVFVTQEVLPDGTVPVKVSNSIKVF